MSPGDLREDGVPKFLRKLERCLQAGLQGLLLREPDWEHGPLFRLAQEVGEVLRASGASLWLHNAPHLVGAAGAHGVHLGFRSVPPLAARKGLEPGHSLGLSTHAGDDPDPEGVDYVFYSPVFDTPSKRGLVDPVGLQGLGERVEASRLPVWALGGIDGERAAGVWQQGVAGLVVRSALWEAKNPAKLLSQLGRS